MNYTKSGIRASEEAVNSIGTKIAKKFTLFVIRLFIIALIGSAVIGGAAGLGVFKGIISSSPDIGTINVTPTGFSSFIYNNQGQQTAKLVASDSNRIPVSWDMIPKNLANAFVAIEDSRFYSHNGIDIQGIMRAAFVAIKKRNLSEGASTITQQLLKNNVFTGWTEENGDLDRIKRKIQEQYLAIQLEKTMSKEDILLNYMNTINLGQNTLGVQAASLRYFNKSVYELTLSECAVIAGITQNPSKYNPISHPDYNADRREKVLKDMLKQELITQAEFDEALADDVYSRIQSYNEEVEDTTVNSYFDDAVTDAVYDDLIAAGYSDNQAYTLIYSGGISIYSTQDPDIQKICDEVTSNEENYPEGTKYYLKYKMTVEKASGETENHSAEMFRTYFRASNAGFNDLFSSHDDAYAAIEEYKNAVMSEGDIVLAEDINITPQPQISLTIANQSTGEVVALVGGRGAKTASRTLNRATSSARQPGSTFKVVSTYAPALDSAGQTLATVYNDAPFNYASGTPVRNWYSSGYRGINSLRDGIRDSLNIITVKCLTVMGPQLGYDYLLDFGFTTLVDRMEINGQIYSDIQQSLALGGITKGVTNLELNAAYATIANQGTYIKPKLYTKVVDREGNVILDNTVGETRQVLKPTTAYLLTSAMKDVVTSGTGGKVNFGNMAIAGKTGTTTDYNDVWFAGYTPYYTATTWAGFDNNAKLKTSSEKDLAKTIWRKAMEEIHKNLEYQDFPMPGGLVTATVCSRSGKLPIAGLCDHTLKSELFEEGTVPTEYCNVHYAGAVCAYSMRPACDTCPFRTEGVFELALPEDPALASGSSTLTSTTVTTTETLNEDGTTSLTYVPCPHNAIFMADPSAPAVIEAQRAEIDARNALAAAALAATAGQ